MNDRDKMINKIESFLYKYNTYKVGIKTLQKQLDYIMPTITSTFEVSEGSTGTFNIKSDTERYAIDRIESRRALELREDIERYNVYIESIDEAVHELSETERNFIIQRYIKNKSIIEVSMKLGYSEKYVFEIRNRAFDKLVISLKGLMQF